MGVVVIVVIWVMVFMLVFFYGFFNLVWEMDIFVVKVIRCRLVFFEFKMKWEQYLIIVIILVQYVILLIIIGVVYVRIIYKFWLRNQLGYVIEDQCMCQICVKCKSIKFLIVVVMVFVVCWMLFNLYYFLMDFYFNIKMFKYDSFVFFVCLWVVVSSMCINLFLYCWINFYFWLRIMKKKVCCEKKEKLEGLFEELEDMVSGLDINIQEMYVYKFLVFFFLKQKLDKFVYCQWILMVNGICGVIRVRF